ncbi:efflux RND transporter periplasmic adaptor subunit [Alteromonas antoniana]|uniref:efflux RND transporter periplasmic adaptor subunit n=1 Tax=Alteromonas antoniana TaxID=2803813 RepID=UPI001C448047|nr:efflux RND transporter periplasmic adaptor subunit [Alteromonas antoniana]
MKTSLTIIATAVVGIVIGGVSVSYYQSTKIATDYSGESKEEKPLYWVAPMDDSYRRDGPGKSPMGMDLVPVYADDSRSEDSPGTVSVSPTVVNNLGVKTAAVTSGVLDTRINTVGYVQYNEDNLVHIHPRVEGWIDSLFVKAQGDPVEKNTPLYTLYSPQLVNAQEEYLIALKRADSTLIRAARDRLAALQLSSQFIDRLTKTRTVEQTVTFYAPQSGVVDALQVREGFYVKPGTTVMSIGKLDSVWVEAEVFESDTALIEAGQTVTMTLDYLPGKVWEGQVDYVYPSLNPTTRTLRVRLAFDNDNDALKPNMFAQLTIHAQQGESTLLVPRSAVISTGSQERVVLAKGDGKFKSVEVTTGRANGEQIQILDGLMKDDIVVISAQFLIDSESSKTSDFLRMSDSSQPPSVWVEGEVQRVIAAHRMATISHAPVPEWDWPAMTMDFTVDDNVDIEALANAVSLHMEITKAEDGNYRISGIHIMSTKDDNTASQATVNGEIEAIDAGQRVMTIHREAIEKWNRPPATMDFTVADHIDMSAYATGDSVRFTFEVGEDFVITELTHQSDNAGSAENHDTHRAHQGGQP